MKQLRDLEENYELEIERIVKEIKKQKARTVLLQFPDGFKPYAFSIVNELERLTNNKVNFFIWMESCFGACDIPNIPKQMNIDLLIQFGHKVWE
jgi:2-(3-amino-3-carboxypropyl)histidine synthase